jgi:hypothetical protein
MIMIKNNLLHKHIHTLISFHLFCFFLGIWLSVAVLDRESVRVSGPGLAGVLRRLGSSLPSPTFLEWRQALAPPPSGLLLLLGSGLSSVREDVGASVGLVC